MCRNIAVVWLVSGRKSFGWAYMELGMKHTYITQKIHTDLLTKITEVNSSVFVYRLFHE